MTLMMRLLLIGVAASAYAAVPDTLTAPFVDSAPVIDGDPGDWQLALFGDDAQLFLNENNGTINSGDIDDDADFSATTYVAYDDDMLYVLAIATDDALDQAFADGNNWQNDCIELWVDGADDVGAFPGQEDNAQINVDIKGAPWVYRDAGGVAATLLPLVLGGATETADGWVIEAAVPLNEMPNTQIEAGGQIGFNISFVDSDGGAWNHLLWLGAVETNVGEWGKLIFSDESLGVEPVGKLATTWASLKR